MIPVSCLTEKSEGEYFQIYEKSRMKKLPATIHNGITFLKPRSKQVQPSLSGFKVTSEKQAIESWRVPLHNPFKHQAFWLQYKRRIVEGKSWSENTHEKQSMRTESELRQAGFWFQIRWMLASHSLLLVGEEMGNEKITILSRGVVDYSDSNF